LWVLIWVIGFAAEEPTIATGLIERTVPRPLLPPALPSCMVSQAWHLPQRPTHFGVFQPQSEQVNKLLATDMLQNYQLGQTALRHA
jgi:hypothetical protein